MMFLFSRSTWDLIHTWTGILMIIAAVLHLAQRWKWVVRVTSGVGRGIASRFSADRAIDRVPLAEREGVAEGGAL